MRYVYMNRLVIATGGVIGVAAFVFALVQSSP